MKWCTRKGNDALWRRGVHICTRDPRNCRVYRTSIKMSTGDPRASVEVRAVRPAEKGQERRKLSPPGVHYANPYFTPSPRHKAVSRTRAASGTTRPCGKTNDANNYLRKKKENGDRRYVYGRNKRLNSLRVQFLINRFTGNEIAGYIGTWHLRRSSSESVYD